jgi:hypothetical protein
VATRSRGMVGLALIGMALLGCAKSPDMIVKELRSSIQQTLPMGSDRGRVTAFLRSHEIEDFSYYQNDRAIHAIIRNVSRSFFGFFRTDIVLEFRFDDDDKLTSYLVDKVVTGL